MPLKFNRLIHEKSPYLLQHAHNPVDWYPWSEEAFDQAKKLDRPIFLSIGYATCHWCHVMEKESFCNEVIADVLNENFICIKVDREELPEVDSLYMEFAQMLMSSGAGWPLNLILTSDLKPFYAMTYLPPYNTQGIMGLKEMSLYIKELWQGENRAQVLDQAQEILDVFKEVVEASEDDVEFPTKELIIFGMQVLLECADTAYGGRKGSPKFPLSYQIEFLMEYANLYGDSRPMFYSELTLEMMQRGGIYDHIGGGFARYSVDDKWLIPHFEKMLIDNAILAKTYLEAYKFTKRECFKLISQQILDFILREMTDQNGGFYSAQDADSKGEEGLFYTWTLTEIFSCLDENDALLFSEFFNLSEEGNFEGRNVLYQSQSLEEFAERKKIDILNLKSKLDEIKQVLYYQRSNREHPLKDDKIITSWNAQVIDSLIHAGHLFGKQIYIEAAVKALSCLKKNLYQEGFLLRRYRDGEAKFNGNLDDYASLIKALLSLFEYGQGLEHLLLAKKLIEVVIRHFKSEIGGFYFTAQDSSSLLFRRSEFNDGSEPASNSLLAENFLRLYQITQDPVYQIHAEDIFKAAGSMVFQYPQSYIYYLKVLMRYFNDNAMTIVVALDEESSLKKEFLMWLSENSKPHVTCVWKYKKDDLIVKEFSYLKDKNPIDGQTALYVCSQKQCFAPVLNLEDLKKIISSL